MIDRAIDNETKFVALIRMAGRANGPEADRISPPFG
jgi:hypothetical protein